MKFSWLLAVLLLTGCLKTREELRSEAQDPSIQRQTAQMQRDRATEVREKAPPSGYRFEELDEQIRQMNGRIDTIENHLAQLNAASSNQRDSENKDQQAQAQKFVAFEEALKKLEAQLATLTQEVEKLKTPAPTVKSQASTGGGRSSYDEGESLFSAKKWRESIVAYQKYRDENPKGKSYADATYKMGVAFQELGMKDEARAFLEEVKDKFPNSKEAKKAVYRMKSLK